MQEHRTRRLQLAGQLFWTFLKIGAFTFGGGYAMIPLIEREAADRRGWVTGEDILEVVAIAESTPGPIAINAATFVGYRVCGLVGAVCATLGVVLPSFAIILAIARVLSAFEGLAAVQYAFRGIRAGVLALIVRALWSMYRKCPRQPLAYLIAAGAFLCAAVFGVDVLLVIIGCALFGLVTTLIARRRGRL